MDIKQITTDELIGDRFDSLADIKICELSLSSGIEEEILRRCVQRRIGINRKIVKIVNDELERRRGGGA